MRLVTKALVTLAVSVAFFAVAPAVMAQPYGPDTCRDGYVWRDAAPGDHVCVTPNSRAIAADENSAARSRIDPRGAYGPNTCIPGFVWREAFGGDVVCVTPDRRAQVREENRQGPSLRLLAYGPDTCRDGFVWREAARGDVVCVTPASRQTVADENRAARSRIDPRG
ncbi:MAG: hypothetical protein ACO1OK_03260, partial [Devosia sp.]